MPHDDSRVSKPNIRYATFQPAKFSLQEMIPEISIHATNMEMTAFFDNASRSIVMRLDAYILKSSKREVVERIKIPTYEHKNHYVSATAWDGAKFWFRSKCEDIFYSFTQYLRNPLWGEWTERDMLVYEWIEDQIFKIKVDFKTLVHSRLVKTETMERTVNVTRLCPHVPCGKQDVHCCFLDGSDRVGD